MPIHIGLSVQMGNLAFYDTNQDWKTRKEHVIKFTPVQGNEIEKVDCMFGEIKSKINAQEFGCVCIYLNPGYGNEMRKKLVESGLNCGFKNVEFIHEFSLFFINALSGTNYKPVNGNVIWIKMGNMFYVWYKNNQKAKFIGQWHTLTSELADLEKIVAESKLNKGPDVLFCERKIEETKFRKLLPHVQFFNYQFRNNWSNRACVIKSLITLGRNDFSHLDVVNISSTETTLEIGNNKIAEFGYGINLPVVYYSQKITKTSEKDELKITPINWPIEIFRLPNYNEFYLTFQIDSNEIYSVVFSDHPYECVQSQDNIETDVAKTFNHPFVYLVTLFPFLKYFRFLAGKTYKDSIRCCEELSTFYKRLIQEHRETINYEGEPRDYTDAFLMTQRKHNPQLNEEGEWSDKQLIGVVGDMFFAGIETTTTTLEMFVYYMIHNPEIQKKLYEELDRVIGKDKTIAMSDQPKLPYFNACLQEVQRITVVAPINLFHRTSEEITIDGYIIPKDTIIIPEFEMVHKDEKQFPDP